MRTAERLVALLLGEAEEAPMIAVAFVYEPYETKPTELIFRNEADLAKLRELVPRGYNALVYRYDTQKYQSLTSDRAAFTELVHQTMGVDKVRQRVTEIDRAEKQKAIDTDRAERIKPQGNQPKVSPEPEKRRDPNTGELAHTRSRSFAPPPGYYLKNKRVPTQVVRPQGKPSPQPSSVRPGEVRHQAPGYRFDKPWPKAKKSPIKIEPDRYKPWLK